MEFVERTYERPLISVIIAGEIYDERMKRSIDSVLSQSYEYREVIVIVSDSEDAPSGDASVTFFPIAWKGLPNALNVGVEKGKGELLLFLPSGDEVHSEFLEKGNEAIQLFNASAFHCTTMAEKNGAIDSLIFPVDSGGRFNRKLLMRPDVRLHSFLLRKETCVPFSSNLDYTWQWHMLLESLKEGKVVARSGYVGAFTSATEFSAAQESEALREELDVSNSFRSYASTPLSKVRYIINRSRRYAQYLRLIEKEDVGKDMELEEKMEGEKLLPPFLFRINRH